MGEMILSYTGKWHIAKKELPKNHRGVICILDDNSRTTSAFIVLGKWTNGWKNGNKRLDKYLNDHIIYWTDYPRQPSKIKGIKG